MPETAETFGFGFGFDDLGYIGKAIETIGKQVFLQPAEALRKATVLLRR